MVPGLCASRNPLTKLQHQTGTKLRSETTFWWPEPVNFFSVGALVGISWSARCVSGFELHLGPTTPLVVFYANMWSIERSLSSVLTQNHDLCLQKPTILPLGCGHLTGAHRSTHPHHQNWTPEMLRGLILVSVHLGVSFGRLDAQIVVKSPIIWAWWIRVGRGWPK